MPAISNQYEASREKALELFSARGFGQVSMRELSTHIGLSPGSLYYHFPSKQHLLFDLIEELYEELTLALSDCICPDRSPQTNMACVIRAHVTLHRKYRFHFQLARRDVVCLSTEHRAAIARLQGQYADRLLALLRVNVRTPETLVRAQALREVLEGAPAWLENSQISDEQHVSLVERLVMGAIDTTFPAWRETPATHQLSSSAQNLTA